MNINEENNPYIHFSTLNKITYLDFHFPRKNLEHLYVKIDLGRIFWGITIGIWDAEHHIKEWRKITFYMRSRKNNHARFVFKVN